VAILGMNLKKSTGLARFNLSTGLEKGQTNFHHVYFSQSTNPERKIPLLGFYRYFSLFKYRLFITRPNLYESTIFMIHTRPIAKFWTAYFNKIAAQTPRLKGLESREANIRLVFLMLFTRPVDCLKV